MDKILVEVYIPASSQTYDVFIPAESKIWEVAYLLSNTMTELTQGYFNATENTVLCDRETGTIYSMNQTVEEVGLLHGAKLMLL